MPRTVTVVLVLALGQAACTRPTEDSAKTPLPTQQTTIEPVKLKLDTAAKDAERRRQEVDDAPK